MKNRANPKIVQVYGHDGCGLYVNGKLISSWFTVGEGDILKAVGFKKWEMRKLDQEWYNTTNLPARLSDCKFEK